MTETEKFIKELRELCGRHNARLFARKDSKGPMIGLMVGEVWTDWDRILEEEAVNARP